MRHTPQTWLEAYAGAWRAFDVEAAADLFAEDVAYSFDPFDEPRRGRDAVLAYWRSAFAGQRAVDLSVRLWAVDGPRAGAEWWAVITPHEGETFTLSASLLLCFDGHGRCRELHEHWLRSDAAVAAPARFA